MRGCSGCSCHSCGPQSVARCPLPAARKALPARRKSSLVGHTPPHHPSPLLTVLKRFLVLLFSLHASRVSASSQSNPHHRVFDLVYALRSARGGAVKLYSVPARDLNFRPILRHASRDKNVCSLDPVVNPRYSVGKESKEEKKIPSYQLAISSTRYLDSPCRVRQHQSRPSLATTGHEVQQKQSALSSFCTSLALRGHLNLLILRTRYLH